jgi:hypothetical protein
MQGFEMHGGAPTHEMYASEVHALPKYTPPPHLIIYLNRVGLESKLALTRLLTQPLDHLAHCPRSLGLVFDLLRYITRSYVYRIPNRITCLPHLQVRNSIISLSSVQFLYVVEPKFYHYAHA